MVDKFVILCLILAQVLCISSAEISFYTSPYKTNWFDAVETCHRRGMRLAVLNTPEKHEAAVQLGKSIKPPASQFFGFWLGASDLAYGGGAFMWHDPGSFVKFARWNQGEPSGGNEHCVTLYYWPDQKFNWTWNDAPCDTTLYALCEPRGC